MNHILISSARLQNDVGCAVVICPCKFVVWMPLNLQLIYHLQWKTVTTIKSLLKHVTKLLAIFDNACGHCFRTSSKVLSVSYIPILNCIILFRLFIYLFITYLLVDIKNLILIIKNSSCAIRWIYLLLVSLYLAMQGLNWLQFYLCIDCCSYV